MATPPSSKQPKHDYLNEERNLEIFRQKLQEGTLQEEDIKAFADKYEDVLTQLKLITSVGNRLQRKLNNANKKLKAFNITLRKQKAEIERINKELERTNRELRETIDELIRARAGRKATTFVLVFVIVLFIISESIEIYIEQFSQNIQKWGSIISWTLKALLALLFKPIESFFENMFTKRAMDQVIEERKEVLQRS